MKVNYIQPDGTRHEIEAEPGNTVMETAVDNDVPGIVAECGGGCSCATCHVQVTPEWYARVGQPEDIEQDMLEFVVDRKDTSRLGCQIELTPELDGLTVNVPESQY